MSKKLMIKTPHNGDAFNKIYERNSGISNTIPDQTMSLREIVTRFANGMPIEGNSSAYYDGEDYDNSEYDHLDLVERQEYLLAAKERVKTLESSIREENEKKKREKPTKPEQGSGDENPEVKLPSKPVDVNNNASGNDSKA